MSSAKKFILPKNGAKPAQILPELTGYICPYRNGTGPNELTPYHAEAVANLSKVILWRDQP